jgi:hypothetical protein
VEIRCPLPMELRTLLHQLGFAPELLSPQNR